MCSQWRIHRGGWGGSSPPYGLQPPLEQGELEEEKVKGEEEEEEEEGFSPPMAVTWIRHCVLINHAIQEINVFNSWPDL